MGLAFFLSSSDDKHNLSSAGFWSLVIVLTTLMLMTRSHHFATAIHLPDASLAVFFLAGRYLRQWWTIIVYFLLALITDYFVIHYQGVSNYCFTVSYAFLLPTYASLWVGGFYTRQLSFLQFNGLTGLVTIVAFSTAIAFFISNTSFYWLSGRIVDPSFSHYLEQFLRYVSPYMTTPWLWLCIAGFMEVIIKYWRSAVHQSAHQQ